MGRVSVTLTNSQAWITQCSDSTFETLREFWSFYPPGYRFHPAYKKWAAAMHMAKMDGIELVSAPGWDGKIRLFKEGAVPAGLFRATRKMLSEDYGIESEIEYDLPKLPEFKNGFDSKDKQYLFQNKAVNKMCKAVRRGGGIILSATGSGKTKMAAQFFSKMPFQCLFIVDQIDLLYQTRDELAKWLGEKVGIVGDSEFIPQRITVATIQTLHLHSKRKKCSLAREFPEINATFVEWLKGRQIVVVDELHEAMAKRNFTVLDIIEPIARFGLTATLQLKRKEIRTRAYAFAGPVLFEFPIAQAMEQNVVTKGDVLQLLFDPDDYMVKEYQDDYRINVVENEVKRKTATSIVDALLPKDRYVFLLVERVRHLKLVGRSLKANGISRRLVYGDVDKVLRVAARKKFERGDIQAIVANKVFKRGINVKRVDLIIDMAEMRSKNDALQKFGRGVRLHKHKDRLLYIDFGTREGRFLRNARSRANAFRQAGIPVKTLKVKGTQDAVQAVMKHLSKLEAAKQLKLPF